MEYEKQFYSKDMTPEDFKKLDKMKNIPPEALKKTKTIGAALYWVSLLSNMAILGFTLPHFLNKMLRYTVEKDKTKAAHGV